MAQITVAATTAVDDTVSHQTEAATLTGDPSNQTTTQTRGNNTTQPDRYLIEDSDQTYCTRKILGSFQCGRTQDIPSTDIQRRRNST